MYKKLYELVCNTLRADIVKVFSFTAISTLVRMLTGFVSVKVVALIIGPSGIALLGQLNNFSSIIMAVACGGINTGVTKYIAECKEDNEIVKKLVSTAFRITIWCSSICGIAMIIFSVTLSRIIMRSSAFGYVFVFFGLTIFFYALNMLLSSILDGYKEFKKYVVVNIVGSIVGLIFTLTFVYSFGLKGALISAVTFQSIMLFISLWMIRRLPWASKAYFTNKFDKEIAKKYFRYTLMTFATAATVPLSQLLLRGYVISNISSVEAGWWEAMNRISNIYLMVITTSFSVYYLPRLSEIKHDGDLKQEIFKAYKIIVPVLLFGFTIIYFCRFIIIKVLFTKEFLSMENLFMWQLIGDFFKICSWLLAYLMIAKAMTKMFIATEIIFSLFFILLGFVFMRMNGVVGLTQALTINYFIYFVCMIILFRKILMAKVKADEY